MKIVEYFDNHLYAIPLKNIESFFCINKNDIIMEIPMIFEEKYINAFMMLNSQQLLYLT